MMMLWYDDVVVDDVQSLMLWLLMLWLHVIVVYARICDMDHVLVSMQPECGLFGCACNFVVITS
jgi:hypothetical protein